MSDVKALAALLAILFAQEADFTPDTRRQSRALRLILKQPGTGRILCATDQDGVIGMVSLLFTVSTAQGGRAAWMEDLVVQPDKRGRGIGERLLKEAISAARTAGCSRITVLTDAHNDRAKRLYRRAGFVPSAMSPLRLYL